MQHDDKLIKSLNTLIDCINDATDNKHDLFIYIVNDDYKIMWYIPELGKRETLYSTDNFVLFTGYILGMSQMSNFITNW